jgi:hypothetical protein
MSEPDQEEQAAHYMTTIDRAHAEIARLDAVMRDMDLTEVAPADQLTMGLQMSMALCMLAAAEAVIDLSLSVDADQPAGRHEARWTVPQRRPATYV